MAAGIAWVVAQFVPGGDEYPYYAPLGAVVATSVTIAASLRGTMRAFGAILIGAVVASVVDTFFEPSSFTVAAVVAVGVLLSALPVLGDKGSWVPTAALFVLVLGEGDSLQYTLSYAGLVLAGALIGTVISVLAPQVPTAPMASAVTSLRVVLCDQLESLAAGLEQQELPDERGWTGRQLSIESRLVRVQTELQRVQDSRHGNLRAVRHRVRLEQATEEARALAHCAWLAQDLTQIISGEERLGNSHLALGSELRPPTVEALRAVAGALASHRQGGADPGRIEQAWTAMAALTERLGTVRGAGEDGLHVASNIVNSLQRILRSVQRARDATHRAG
ncbi:hypothetical protein ACQCX2_04495 [Propionibacteriaceae bacterium Y1700]|uniref:hypothetical protein n=1 Tax=Microlunatus sp. Y1700 TaxID=3418487 RepID=UPI003DA77FDF